MMFRSSVSAILFLSTPSARRATRPADGLSEPFHISIHALREEGDHAPSRANLGRNPISIHALREEGDADVVKQRVDFLISIHALREEGDHGPVSFSPMNRLFLSTPSARRATGQRKAQGVTKVFLSTPSARRATDRVDDALLVDLISIHALREEGDSFSLTALASTMISIHALREEGDAPASSLPSTPSNFYPRPPRGGRLQHSGTRRPSLKFLSTPSARRAT